MLFSPVRIKLHLGAIVVDEALVELLMAKGWSLEAIKDAARLAAINALEQLPTMPSTEL